MSLRIGSLLFALPGILLLVLYGIEMSAFTACQESGGHYNIVEAVCTDTPQPHSSYYLRHSGLVNSMMLLSCVGALMMCWGLLIKGSAKTH